MVNTIAWAVLAGVLWLTLITLTIVGMGLYFQRGLNTLDTEGTAGQNDIKTLQADVAAGQAALTALEATVAAAPAQLALVVAGLEFQINTRVLKSNPPKVIWTTNVDYTLINNPSPLSPPFGPTVTVESPFQVVSSTIVNVGVNGHFLISYSIPFTSDLSGIIYSIDVSFVISQGSSILMVQNSNFNNSSSANGNGLYENVFIYVADPTLSIFILVEIEPTSTITPNTATIVSASGVPRLTVTYH